MSDENLFTTFIGDKRQKETEIADSLAAIQEQKDSIRLANEKANNPIITNVSSVDDISLDYIGDQDSQWLVGGDGKYKDVDVLQIYDALNMVHVTGTDKDGNIQTTPGGQEIFDLGNWMYLDDTPLGDGGIGFKGFTKGKYTGFNPSVHTGWWPGQSDAKDRAMSVEDAESNPNYMGWTAANAFGMGYMNMAGESSFFDTYNNEVEAGYNELTGEDQWFGLIPDSWIYDEQSVGHQIRLNYGEDAFQRIHAKAYEKAKNEQLIYIQDLIKNHPDSNKVRSLMKSLSILKENAEEYENIDNIYGFDINDLTKVK